jgi:hypothetical protein
MIGSVGVSGAEDMSAAGDLGRRIFARRIQLNLTIEQVAERAAMAGGYIEYLEQDPTANPSIEGLAKLAFALEISMSDLAGGQQGRARGRGRAASAPVLTELGRDQCEDLMRAGGIGRVVFRAPDRPVAIPVNFKMLETAIVFRSTEHGSIGEIDPGELVSFEVDRFDDAMSEGWSVLASGTSHCVSEPAELLRVEALGVEPWAGAGRNAYFCIAVTALSGRRIDAAR